MNAPGPDLLVIFNSDGGLGIHGAGAKVIRYVAVEIITENNNVKT